MSCCVDQTDQTLYDPCTCISLVQDYRCAPPCLAKYLFYVSPNMPASSFVTLTSGPGVKVQEFLCATMSLACAFERNKEK